MRWYNGPPKGTNEVAVLNVQRDWTIILSVDAIDGKPLKSGKTVVNNTREIELLPGQHNLEVSYRDDNDNRSTTDSKISFDAEIGKRYELFGAPLERSFGKALRQGLLFQNWYWTMWIVETESKKVVAGTPRTTPLHWYE